MYLSLYALASLHSHQTQWRNMLCMYLLSGIMLILNVWYASVPFVSLDIFSPCLLASVKSLCNLKPNRNGAFHKNEDMVM